jgi:hypothetical protein
MGVGRPAQGHCGSLPLAVSPVGIRLRYPPQFSLSPSFSISS